MGTPLCREVVNTGLDDSSEDGAGVDGGTVPSSMAELVLTLVYGVDCASLDGGHEVDVALADLPLLSDKSRQLVALLLLTNVIHGRYRRYRPATSSIK